MKPEHHSLDVRGLRIHWVEWGKQGSQPLILIHGFRDHCRTWDFFVDELLATLPDLWLVAPDCRGHGDSGWVGAGGYYHFFDYLLDLDALIRHLGQPVVRLVGHSMGGTIACLYAGTHPERVYLEQFREFLRRVACPTLVVQGAESDHRERGDIEARCKLVPGASLVTVADAGHMVQQDNPEALAGVLASFLA